MVKHFGYCPSLRKKVDFEVSEVVDIPTKRGIKYQIKGNYEGRLCNTFCSASKAQELRTQIGSPKVFTVMEAEESQENLAQATQEESVPPIIGPSEKAYGQEGEAAQELPLAQTMPTPIISADDMSVQPIDDLSLPDVTIADMQQTLDVPPTMDADFEIAEMQPEGDGSSIGNITPMNPDAPLHAEDFDAEESQENLGQATQEESVPVIIGPSQEAYGQEGEAAQELPLAETVPTPIISAVDMNIVSNDSLSSFNGGDILSQMESNLGERPEIMADFAIRPYQLFGQGRSIGNIAPMNPDVPFASEDDDDDDDDDFDAESISQFDIELMAQVPPPVCFAEKIPPSVWENTPLQDQLDYASSKNEGLLDCPQCGISKAELRSQGGYCGTTDPESEEYISSRSCPYEKYFAPQHWVDEPQVISHITPERIVLEDTLMAEVDMPATDPIMAAVETRFIPKGLFYQINSMLPDGVVANQTIDGMSYELSYYGMDTEALDKIIDSQSQGYDIMFGAETFEATDVGKRMKCRGCSQWEFVRGVPMNNFLQDDKGKWRCYDCLYDKPKHKVVVIGRGKHKPFVSEAETFEAREGVHPCGCAFGPEGYDGDIESYPCANHPDCDVGRNSAIIQQLKSQFRRLRFLGMLIGGNEVKSLNDLDKKMDMTHPSINIRNRSSNKSYLTWLTNEQITEELGLNNENLKQLHEEWGVELGSKLQEMIFDLSYTVNDRISSRQTHLGADSFGAESKKKPSKTAEKAILTGASTGATMEIADALLAAEEDEEEEFMYHVYISDYSNSVGFIDDYNRDFENQSDAKKAAEKVAKNEGKGKWVLVVAEIAEDEYEEIIYEITPDGDVYDAETFDVEFDDWADQEMKSHGENVSFKKWAKEEGKKHGDVPITDWAEHEEESHDERYGAEDEPRAIILYDIVWENDMDLPKGVFISSYDEETLEGHRHEEIRDYLYQRFNHFPQSYKMQHEGNNYGGFDAFEDMKRFPRKYDRRYGAENFESQSAQTKMKPSLKSIGILLGLGAIAAVAAPENLKKMFKR